jgi:hypothetical protein
MLFNANLPPAYWVEAFSSAVHIINRLPTKLLNHKSPFEILYAKTPNYNTFRAFGCRVFPCLRDYSDHKLAPRSIPCIFIGYNSQYKGFKCLDPTTSRIYISRNAQFNESLFPFKSQPIDEITQQLTLATFLEENLPIVYPTLSPAISPQPTPPINDAIPCTLCQDIPTSSQPTDPTTPTPQTSPNTSPSTPFHTSKSFTSRTYCRTISLA